jgi:iron complex transport system substrate-binding protein
VYVGRRGFLQLCCGAAAAAAFRSAQAAAPRTVTDFRGRSMTLNRPASRIVCLIESALSGLYMLGAGDRLVGVPANVYSGEVAPHYARLDARLAARKLPTPGNWDFVSIESVLALRPDLVIVWSHQREAIDALERHGIPVYGVFIASLDDLRKEMRDFSVLTATEARAAQLLAHTDAEVARIAEAVAVPEAQRPSVYFAWGQGMLETSCRGSMVDDLIRLAGGRNVCTDALEHATVSLERVLRWNPEVLILWRSPGRTAASVLTDPQWRAVTAVRSRRVYELPEVFDCDLWTLKFLHALALFASWFHPQRFARPGALERDAMMAFLYANKATH